MLRSKALYKVNANWSKDGKFHAGSRHNQVKFVNQNELNAHPEDFEFSGCNPFSPYTILASYVII